MNPTPSVSLSALSRLRAWALPVALVISSSFVVRAADGTWNVDTNGNWVLGTTGSWFNGIVAEGAGSTAYFNTIGITANRTVTLTASLTIGNLAFGNTSTGGQTWTLGQSGGSALTLQTLSGAPVITVDNNTATISAGLSGSQGFTKEGAGRLVLSGVHALTGTLTVNAGTLDLWGTTSAYSNDINLAAAGSTLDAANTATNSVITLDGNITGLGKINKTGGVSTLILTGDNTYSGGTTLTAGTIVMGTGANNGLGTGTLTMNGGALRSSDVHARTIANVLSFGSNNLTLGAAQNAVDGTGDLNFTWTGSTSIGGSKTWTVNNTTTATFNNNWSGNSGWNVTKAGTGALIFNGNLTSNGVGVVVSAGTFILNGSANTYTGATSINGGIMRINGAKTGTGAVAVNNTGTLGGSGSISGAATAGAGSFLSPGASSGAVGTLTFTSTLDISGLASGTGGLLFDLGAAGASDKIMSGALTIGSGLLDLNDFNFTTLTGYGEGTYTLFSATSIIGTLGSGLTGMVGGLAGVLSISGNDIVLTVSAVPEPSAYAMIVGAGLLGFAVVRRRRMGV